MNLPALFQGSRRGNLKKQLRRDLFNPFERLSVLDLLAGLWLQFLKFLLCDRLIREHVKGLMRVLVRVQGSAGTMARTLILP